MKTTFIINCNGVTEADIFDALLSAAIGLQQKRVRCGGAQLKANAEVNFQVATVDPEVPLTVAEAIHACALVQLVSRDIAAPERNKARLEDKALKDDLERDLELFEAVEPVNEIASFTAMQEVLNRVRHLH